MTQGKNIFGKQNLDMEMNRMKYKQNYFFEFFLTLILISIFSASCTLASSVPTKKEALEMLPETISQIRKNMNDNPEALSFYFIDNLVYPLGYNAEVLSISREVLDKSSNTKSIEIVGDGLYSIVKDEFNSFTPLHKKKKVADLIQLVLQKNISVSEKYRLFSAYRDLGGKWRDEAYSGYIQILKDSLCCKVDESIKRVYAQIVNEVCELSPNPPQPLIQQVISHHELIELLEKSIRQWTNKSQRDREEILLKKFKVLTQQK